MFHKNLDVKLTSFQKKFLLSCCPPGTRIVSAKYFDNYDLPCPIRAEVAFANGEQKTFVLRSARHGSTVDEAKLLSALSKLELPVPLVLGWPVSRGRQSIVLLSLLPGTNLQALSMQSQKSLVLARRLLIQGVERLSKVTATIAKKSIGKALPRYSLLDQLQMVSKKRSKWSTVPVVVDAAKQLTPELKKIKTKLVFTNGDYQPGNFLTDGKQVTGFVDFESACFQDPLIGFAKYPIYDLHPMNKAGTVKAFLNANHFTERDFAPRLALGCLIILQKEIPVQDGSKHDRQYRKHVLGLLKKSLSLLS